ncbi:MAG: hypothetical protein ABJX32_05285 [Tateyamaria sp.]|uniref:hypothetical protein n=1 Tax=Tateyamaria sp. TaxID=1929288 RepID=UPI00329A8092
MTYRSNGLLTTGWGVLWYLALGIIAILTPSPAQADLMPLNGAAVAPNIAEITVQDDGVVVKLEVYVGDLGVFRDLLPNEFLSSDTSERASLDERLDKFSREGLQIIADGTRLVPQLLVAEPRTRVDRSAALASSQNALSQLPTPKSPDDKRVYFAELKYSFETRPDSLVFVPPTKSNGAVKASIGFIAFHKTVPVIDFRYLSGPEPLRLDWQDPWYTRFDNKNLKRHHTSALMTFLYVEPREVRHETLIRVRDLGAWTDLNLAETGILEAEAQNAIKEAARTFFMAKNPVVIDGEPVKAVSSRVEFLAVSSSGLQIVEGGDSLDLPNAILGVILTFPVPALPQNVTVDWELFNERHTSIRATATDPAGPFLNLISTDSPTIVWKNYLRTYEEPKVTEVVIPVQNIFQVPLLSAMLVIASVIAAVFAIGRRGALRVVLLGVSGVGLVVGALSTSFMLTNIVNPLDRLPDEETSSRIFKAVIENVNIANLESTAQRRNQELETVVAGNAMREVTEELDRALVIRVAGGGFARVDSVQDVELKDTRSLASGTGFQAVVSWSVKASAGHWGHNHKRGVSYRAVVELIEDANVWKLAGITVIDARQSN